VWKCLHVSFLVWCEFFCILPASRRSITRTRKRGHRDTFSAEEDTFGVSLSLSYTTLPYLSRLVLYTPVVSNTCRLHTHPYSMISLICRMPNVPPDEIHSNRILAHRAGQAAAAMLLHAP
jgi:hypothetical protein